jgi:hypothetical protein
MDVISLFNALNPVIANFINLLVIIIAAWGIFVGLSGLVDLYAIADGSGYLTSNRPTINGALIKLALAGAMTVFPVLMWFSANTFVNAGSETYAMFNYTTGTGSGGYCQRFHQTLTIYFMALGVFAWMKAFSIGYAHGRGDSSHGGHAKYYLIFGTLLFYINDFVAAINATLGTKIGLVNLCQTLGGL